MNECPKCKSECHAGDTECKKCGIIFAKFEQAQAKQNLTNATPPSSSQQKRPSLIVLVGGGFLIFVVLLSAYEGLTGINKSRSPSANMAFIQCKDFVLQHLKAPASADFPFVDFTSTALQGNAYVIISYVDAQNSYGATLRNNWRCKVKYLGGDDADPRSWELIEEVKMW